MSSLPNKLQFKLQFALAALAMLAITSSKVEAAEACVVCSEPAATYLCEAQAAPEHQSALNNSRLIQFACIKNIAKAYGHGSCKANQLQSQTCNGQVVLVDLSDMARRLVKRVPAPLRPGHNPKFKDPAAQPNTPTGEPKTVVELAKRTVQSSQRQLKNAGKAVQNAGKVVTDSAKQTWRCLTTFFQKC